MTAPAHEPTDEDENYMYNELVDNDFDPDAGASSVYSEHENKYPFDFDDDNSACLPDTGALRSPGSAMNTFLHRNFRPGADIMDLDADEFRMAAVR